MHFVLVGKNVMTVRSERAKQEQNKTHLLYYFWTPKFRDASGQRDAIIEVKMGHGRPYFGVNILPILASLKQKQEIGLEKSANEL